MLPPHAHRPTGYLHDCCLRRSRQEISNFKWMPSCGSPPTSALYTYTAVVGRTDAFTATCNAPLAGGSWLITADPATCSFISAGACVVSARFCLSTKAVRSESPATTIPRCAFGCLCQHICSYAVSLLYALCVAIDIRYVCSLTPATCISYHTSRQAVLMRVLTIHIDCVQLVFPSPRP